MPTAIGPGVESVGVLLWAAAPTAGRWDRATWDGAPWSAAAWQSVGCDVGELTQRWGASQESGILSVAEAGELDLVTIDPARELDPLNTASPYYGAVKPGTPLRIVGYAPGETPLATAFIDEASFDLASSRGRIRAVDGIAYLAQAQIPVGTALPNTLRARVRAIVAAVGLGAVVPVQPEAASSERLIDGGAEQHPEAPTTPPAGWRISSGGGTFGTSAGATHSGIRAYNVRSVGVYGDGNKDVQKVTPGAVYRFGAWRLRESWADGTLTAFLAWYDATGVYRGEEGPTSLVWPAGLDAGLWTYREVVWTAPAEASFVAIGLRGTAGSEWVDDISLVGPDPDTQLEADPPVAPYDASKSGPAWAAIAEAAIDALTYIWADPTGLLRFRSFGALTDAPINVGCPPADADPADQWLSGLSTIEATAAGDAVRNSVRAYSAGTTWAPATTDPVSVAKYGPRPFDVERVVPDRATWASRILADRSDAGLEVGIGEIRPYTQVELAALLATQLGGPAIVRARDDAHGELVDLDLAMIGARVGMTPAGWRFALVTFLSRVEWDAITPDPPPVIPPVGSWHVETRTYIATSDALLALTSGGSKYGAGASSSLPVGAWQGWTYRALVAFPAIPWAKIRAVRTATLKVQTTTQVRVGFGGSPKTEIRRITSSWSAGSSSSPGSGNAVVWPGPSTSSSGAVTSSLPTGQNAAKSIDVSAIARAWAPASAGGSGAAQYGIRLGEVSSSSSNTGEIWPVEKGGAARPTLELVLEVFD